MRYGSVVFDLDGVLLDSIKEDEWKYDATREALSELGVEVEDREILDALLGDHGYEKCVQVCGDLGVDPREAWSLVAEKTSEARMGKIEEGDFGLVDGSVEVLEDLMDRGIKLGVISNAPDQAVEMVVDHFDLRNVFKFFRGVRTFEDLKARKPHPDHLEMARFQLKHDPFLYVGDHESDVEAAERADMDSAWIGGSAEEPTYSIDSIGELLEIVE